VLTIVNNGIGIRPELLPTIFDLFTQAERSLDRTEGGLGIGLSLARRLTQMHAARSRPRAWA
jgi:signal transduction histidine kinase